MIFAHMAMSMLVLMTCAGTALAQQSTAPAPIGPTRALPARTFGGGAQGGPRLVTVPQVPASAQPTQPNYPVPGVPAYAQPQGPFPPTPQNPVTPVPPIGRPPVYPHCGMWVPRTGPTVDNGAANQGFVSQVGGAVGNPHALGSNRGVVVVNDAGFFAGGRVEGDHFRLGFTVGSSPFQFDRFGCCHSVWRCNDLWGSNLIFYNGYGWYAPYWYGYNWNGPIFGYETRVDPAYVDPFAGMAPRTPLTTVPPTAPATAKDRGDILLRDGLAEQAIDAYKEHLAANADDADTIRRYALALIVDKRFEEGVAMMGLAYQRDVEKLAGMPLDGTLVPGGKTGLRNTVNSTVAFANTARSGSSWLTVMVMMQAEGRSAVALKQLDKARAAGLDREVANVMEKTLKGR